MLNAFAADCVDESEVFCMLTFNSCLNNSHARTTNKTTKANHHR
jgi:hypothetical protein